MVTLGTNLIQKLILGKRNGCFLVSYQDLLFSEETVPEVTWLLSVYLPQVNKSNFNKS